MSRVQLVITCAGTKTRPPPGSRQLRAVPRAAIGSRAAAWVGRLASATDDALPAADLYAGTHWATARVAGEFADHAWVASAGYGLIPFSAPVHSYSATFSLGDPDSVVPPRSKSAPTDPAEWWDALARWEGPSPGQPRRVVELVADRKAFVLVAVSVAYLRALAPDIAAAHAAAPGRVAVICGGAGPSRPLAEVLLPCDARLQAVVGGPLFALNARVALKLLREPPAVWTLTAAREKLAGWLAAAPARVAPNRRGIDDEEVVGFIRRNLTPTATASALLRNLRDRGLACAYSRFVRLFRLARKG